MGNMLFTSKKKVKKTCIGEKNKHLAPKSRSCVYHKESNNNTCQCTTSYLSTTSYLRTTSYLNVMTPYKPLNLNRYKLLNSDKQSSFLHEVTKLYDDIRELRRKQSTYRELIDTILEKETELKMVVKDIIELRDKIDNQKDVCRGMVSIGE